VFTLFLNLFYLAFSPKQPAPLTFTMSDVAETKPDPTTQAPEAATTEKSVTEVAADKAAEVAETAKDAAVKTSDNVFSMFGGGPKKEEKKEEEEENDRSGSAKAQKVEKEGADKEEDVEADKVSLDILGWML
jgi:Ran-binding protein 1